MSSRSVSPADGSRAFAARRFEGSAVVEREEAVAVEAPVAMVFNGHSFAVMLATPLDLEDFARGFALTEGVIENLSEIAAIEVRPVERGIEARLQIPEARALALRARQRSLAGRSGCGVCGVGRFSEALRPAPAVDTLTRVSPRALRGAVADLAGRQALNAEVGAVHAAAFADLGGQIRLLREDIGRHNALDKLIGALSPSGLAPQDGFVLVTSRCSYEMAHKTATAGIGLIAAVSAPTSLAVELAQKLGVGLVGFARERRFTVYASPWRVAEDSEA